MRIALLLALATTACATVEPITYSEQPLGKGVWAVYVRGNTSYGPETLRAMALRRAWDLCQYSGFPHVRIANPETVKATGYVPPSSTATVNSYGGNAHSHGGYTVTAYGINATAVCIGDEEFIAARDAMRQAAASGSVSAGDIQYALW